MMQSEHQTLGIKKALQFHMREEDDGEILLRELFLNSTYYSKVLSWR